MIIHIIDPSGTRMAILMGMISGLKVIKLEQPGMWHFSVFSQAEKQVSSRL
jgi:hypothetical protein